ncbi:MAG: flagellar export chaperone FliS [Planctomycetota bacterium JB042]
MTATMNQSHAAAYQRESILTESPVGLVVKVYQGALTSLDRARRAGRDDDANGFRAHVGKASALVAELLGALDHERGGEIAEQLSALYEFVLTQLLRPTTAPDLAAVEHAERLLSTLKEGFDAIHASGCDV